MSTCAIKVPFNAVLHNNELGMILNLVYLEQLGIKRASGKKTKFDTEGFYLRLLHTLKSSKTRFAVEYSSEKYNTQDKRNLYKSSVEQLRRAIVQIMPDQFWKEINYDEFVKKLLDNLFKDLGGSDLHFSKEEAEKFEIEIVNASDDDDVTDVSLKQFKDSVYKTCFSGYKQLENQFSRNIFKTTILDLKSGKYVISSKQLNDNIGNYKQLLFSTIVDFLNNNTDSLLSDLMYNDFGDLNNNFDDVMSEMFDYIEKNITPQIINQAYAKTLLGEESALIEAVNAYASLKYFDTLLQRQLGKTIAIDKKYRNQEIGISVHKYKFKGDASHHRKSWNDSDAKTAALNTSRFSKFVLDSLPLYIKGVQLKRNVSIMQFNLTLCKLFANVSKITDDHSSVKQLIELILSFHNSPVYNAGKIFDLIEHDLYVQNALRGKGINFSDVDFGVIESVNRFLFYCPENIMRLKWEEVSDEFKSIKAIEFNTLKNSMDLGKYSILSDIIGVMNDCMDMSYLFTAYDYDGSMSTIIRSKSKKRRGAMRFIHLINNSVNQRYVTQEYRKQLQQSMIVSFGSNDNVVRAGQLERDNTGRYSPVTILTSVATVSIPINGLMLKFVVDYNDKLGILKQANKSNAITPVSTELYNRVLEIFGLNSPIDLTNDVQINKILTAKEDTLTPDELIFKKVLQVIDQRLKTNFLTPDGLKRLQVYASLDTNKNGYIQDLLIYSTKVLVVSDIYHSFVSCLRNHDNTDITSWKDFRLFVNRAYPAFRNLKELEESTYFSNVEGFQYLLPIPYNTHWCDAYDYATMVVNGNMTSSTSKNQSGNNDANYVTAFLGGQIQNITWNARQAAGERQNQIDEQYAEIAQEVALEMGADPNYLNAPNKEAAEAYSQQILNQRLAELKLPPMTASSTLLFTQNPLLITLCVVNSDVKNREGKVKSIRNLKSSELFYNAIVHNFWIRYITDLSYCILPTTYSDKVKLVEYLIDASAKLIEVERPMQYHEVVGKTKKDISEMTAEQKAELDAQYAELTKNGVPTKKYKVALQDMTTDEIIRTYSSTIGLAAKNQMDNIIYTYGRIFGKKLERDWNTFTYEEINKILHTYTDIDTLIDDAVSAGVSLQKDLHYRVKKVNGRTYFTLNEIVPYQAQYADPEFLRQTLEKEKVNFVNDLIDSNVQFYTHYTDDNELENDFKESLLKSNSPIAKILLALYDDTTKLTEYRKKWIKNGKLIFAYDNEGNAITYKTTDSVAELNPLFERYFYMDSLLSNNLRFQLTGFESNHPDKSFFQNMWNDVAKDSTNELLNATVKDENTTVDANIKKLQSANIIWTNNIDKDYSQLNTIVVDVLPSNYQALIDAGNTIIVSNLDVHQMQLIIDLHGTETLNGTGIKTIALDNTGLVKSAVFQGDLSFNDVIALRNNLDLHEMFQTQSETMKNVASQLILIVQNIAQGTQLKRNVIVPATMHYMHQHLLRGVTDHIKVAIIDDIEAKAYNFDGLSKSYESMDGSAIVPSFESILENMTLGSQEVGWDKKPIWHYYDHETGTAGLMKFASFVINNARIKMSINSDVPLIKMFRKLTNLLWKEPIDLTKTADLTDTVVKNSNKVKQRKVDFTHDILGGQQLYYSLLNDDGEIEYRQITNFGRDENGYYTIETICDEEGDPGLDDEIKVYHYYDSKGQHSTVETSVDSTEAVKVPEGMHTINSLFELWQAMGGYESKSINEETLQLLDSEASNYAVVGFMNSILVPIEGGDRLDFTQRSYRQPLKHYMIGYLTNNSAMKNGALNENSSKKWFTDEDDLNYMEMASRDLGVQMDADHDVEIGSQMTEFSQVISALEAGGWLHKYAKQVYKDLGRVALTSASIELDALTKFLAGQELDYAEAKSQLYELIGKTLIKGIKSREDQASLTDDILREIEQHFEKNLYHWQSKLKIPFSDPNIFSLILPTLVSVINSKSIKRKFAGAGCVMIPGFNIAQTYQFGGKKYLYNDLLRMAISWANSNNITVDSTVPKNKRIETLVNKYMLELLSKQPILATNTSFQPTDIVNIHLADRTLTITLDDLDSYYLFKDKNWDALSKAGYLRNADGTKGTLSQGDIIAGYSMNITKPRNLAPARVSFELKDGTRMSVFDLKVFKDAYKKHSPANTKAVQEAFRMLQEEHKAVLLDGTTVQVYNIENLAAEMIISNIYTEQFPETKGKTVAEIRDAGESLFLKEYSQPILTTLYDFMFDGADKMYITFQRPPKKGNRHIKYAEKELYTEKNKRGDLDVYLMSDDNRKLFKVGRYVRTVGYRYDPTTELFYDDQDKVVDKKVASTLKHDGTAVYKYIEFVSKYQTTETVKNIDGTIARAETFEKYYINFLNIGKVFNEDENSDKKEHSEQYKSFVISLLEDLYATKQFEGIKLNENLNYKSAWKFVNYVSKMSNIDVTFKREVISKIKNELLPKLIDLRNNKKTNAVIPTTEIVTPYYNNYYKILAKHKYVSWEQSLYFTAARIPAQTLQSFMQMEAVGYTGNTTNQVFVSHFLAWLQGSDYESYTVVAIILI